MKRLLLSLLALPLLAACPSNEGTLDDDDDDDAGPVWEDAPAAVADVFADEADAFDAPGAAVAIRHGDAHYVATYGFKDPDGGDPIEGTTLFRIGSVTKMMTAAGLLVQVDAGTASLDDARLDHVPELDLTGRAPLEEVTLHDLLAHTSGISEITPIDGGEDDDRLASFTVGGFESQAYMMAPAGEFWNYSNPNFALAGLAVEVAGGGTYRERMQQDVFGPLGMDRTMFLGGDVIADGDYAVAWGRGWTPGDTDPRRIEPDDYDDGWSRPAGFAWSSVQELVTFGDFLLGGSTDVMPDSLHAELVGVQAPTEAYVDVLDYGYGTMLWHGRFAGGEFYDVEVIEHGGAISGFAAEIWAVPEHDLVVATLASTDGAYFDGVRHAVFEELLGLEPTDPPPPDIAEDLEVYTGTYQDDFSVGTLTVELADDGGTLTIDAPALDAAGVGYATTLVPTSRDRFIWELYDGTFPLDVNLLPSTETGAPSHWFKSRYFVAERTDEPSDGRALPTPRLAPALLR